MKTSRMALATIAIALASCQSVSAELIKTIAGQCGMDVNTVKNIADEVMTAKSVAESDMQ